MRYGFTMIELIFIIVIIGILASVAIPRINATKSNSEGVKIANNLANCINDAGAAFMKTGFFSGDTTISNALPPNSVACNQGLIPSGQTNPCFVISPIDANGTLSVQNSTSNTAVCIEAQKIAKDNGVGEMTHKYNF